MNNLVILTNIGLGDVLLCNAIIRHHAKNHEIILPCWSHNHYLISQVFNDIALCAYPVESEKEAIALANANPGSIKLGWYNSPFNPDKFDQEFYRQAGIDFEKRWSEFKLPELEVKDPGLGFYSLCRHDTLRGFILDQDRIGPNPIFLKPNSSLEHIVSMVQFASEIHCINSFMLILADSIPTPNAKRLVLHHYARRTIYPTLKKQWEILE